MYKGRIKTLPKEIVEKMLEYQVEQGNERDVTVFERKIDAYREMGGFDWHSTVDSFGFWYAITFIKNFGGFFDKYPRDKTIRR